MKRFTVVMKLNDHSGIVSDPLTNAETALELIDSLREAFGFATRSEAFVLDEEGGMWCEEHFRQHVEVAELSNVLIPACSPPSPLGRVFIA